MKEIFQRTQSPEESSQSWTGNFLRTREWNWLPGPKELMNIQRFYLYLNLTKPSEHLCLSFANSNMKGGGGKPGLSDPYSQTALSAAAPGAGRGAGKLSGASGNTFYRHGLFLEILGSHTDKYEEPLFQELYSWYLRSPEYQELTKS